MDPEKPTGVNPEVADAVKALLARGPEGYAEMARITDADRLRHFHRMGNMVTEVGYWDADIAPNSYVITNVVARGLMEREQMLRISLPLGFTDYTDAEIAADLATDKEKRDRLADEARVGYRETQARLALILKLEEQDAYSADVGTYLKDLFLKLGKVRFDAEFVATILNMPETYPGFEPLGEKVQKAINLWRNVALGEATVDIKIKDPKKDEEVLKRRYLPNVFALQRNEGLLDVVMEHYVMPNIGTSLTQSDADESKMDALKSLEVLDNLDAAILALFLIQHWDLDVEWSIGTEGYKKNPTADDLRNLAMEITQKDSAKAMYVELRRAKEFYGGKFYDLSGRKPKDHLRSVGAPASLGCYPRLTADALTVYDVEVLATGTYIDKDGKPQTKTAEISVSVTDLVWGGGRVSRYEGGHWIEWKFEEKGLGEVPWDEVTVFDANDEVLEIIASTQENDALIEKDKDGKKVTSPLEVGLGISTNAFEIPYKLQGYYAGRWMFDQYTSNEFMKLFSQIVEGEDLWKMNKGVEVAMGMLSGRFNISFELSSKLINYMNTVFLATIAVSVDADSYDIEPEKRSQTSYLSRWEHAGKAAKKLIDRAKTTQFLPIDQKTGEIETVYSTLYDKIVKDRKAPRPSESKLFSTDELKALEPLYPLGV